jgi:hypothetical protein
MDSTQCRDRDAVQLKRFLDDADVRQGFLIEKESSRYTCRAFEAEGDGSETTM